MIKNIPTPIIEVLTTLDNFGASYLVGGCVRDILLNRYTNDYDITTILVPDEVKHILKDFLIFNNNGLKHGTVSMKIAEYDVQITTFRNDGIYSDGRHPNEVIFSTTLKEDLQRRDLTINAIAMNKEGKIFDYFNSIIDLNNKIIRTVGNPYQRFREDYLRILRALRFKQRYNFIVEETTKKAIIELCPKIMSISKERIIAELKEIFISDNLGQLLIEYKKLFKILFNSLDKINNYEEFCLKIDLLPKDFNLRLAYVFAIDNLNLAKIYRLSNQDSKEIDYYLANCNHKLEVLHDYYDLILNTPNLKLLNPLLTIISLKNNLDLNIISNNINGALKMIKAKSIPDLKINGYDLLGLKINQKDISKILKQVLNEVVYNNLLNNKEDIINYIKRSLI